MGILENGNKKESIQKMVASIAITAYKILRSQGINVAHRKMELFPAVLKRNLKSSNLSIEHFDFA